MEEQRPTHWQTASSSGAENVNLVQGMMKVNVSNVILSSAQFTDHVKPL